MNSEQSNISNENNEYILKDIDTYINRMQNMLDWISTTRGTYNKNAQQE